MIKATFCTFMLFMACLAWSAKAQDNEMTIAEVNEVPLTLYTADGDADGSYNDVQALIGRPITKTANGFLQVELDGKTLILSPYAVTLKANIKECEHTETKVSDAHSAATQGFSTDCKNTSFLQDRDPLFRTRRVS